MKYLTNIPNTSGTNIFILLELHRIVRPFQKERQLLKMITLFFLLQVPALVYSVAYGIKKQLVITSQPWQILSLFRNFTVTLNSAVNFILYCAFGQKFRRVFLRIFCKKWAKDHYRSVSERTAFTTNGSSTAHVPMIDTNSNSTKYTHAVGNGDAVL
mgnify:FL=1